MSLPVLIVALHSSRYRIVSSHVSFLVIERERSASRDRRASSVAGPSPYAQIDASLATQLQEQTHCTSSFSVSVEMSSSLPCRQTRSFLVSFSNRSLPGVVDKVEVSRLYEIYALLTDNGSTPIDKVRTPAYSLGVTI